MCMYMYMPNVEYIKVSRAIEETCTQHDIDKSGTVRDWHGFDVHAVLHE